MGNDVVGKDSDLTGSTRIIILSGSYRLPLTVASDIILT
jgi:hypothetical protein